MSNLYTAALRADFNREPCEVLPQRHTDERSLVQRAMVGDADAFGMLFISHSAKIYRYILFRIGDPVEAEDMTEEVFMKAWEALPSYQFREAPFVSWLYRIARNRMIDHHRRKRNNLVQSDLQLHWIASSEPLLEDVISHRYDVDLLIAAFQHLSDDEQQVILLRFVEGWSHPEVAQVIGKSEGACRVMQHRALLKLNVALQEIAVTED